MQVKPFPFIDPHSAVASGADPAPPGHRTRRSSRAVPPRVRAVEDDGIPVAFVHMVAGEHGGIVLPQDFRLERIALEVQPQRFLVGGDQGEHLAAHLEDQGGGVEGEVFDGAVLGGEVGAEGGEVHFGVLSEGRGGARVKYQ